tara:strand:+ start:6657 stop:7625 length:969 start_codon:yes stop_codon:yes gene_type:complete
MQTLKDLNRLPISMKRSLVKEVLPEYFLAEYPTLITFLDAYYENLDSDTNIGDLINDLNTIRDAEDNTLRQLDLMFKEVGLGVSQNQFTSPREVIRDFADFFRVKGTKFSAERFFRTFFRDDVEIEYPKNNLFVVGQSEIGLDSLDVLQDGALYQVLSVLVKAPISIATWEKLYRRFVHPAGFYLGAEVLILTAQTNPLSAPDVILDSDAGEVTIESNVNLLANLTVDNDTSIIQTMGHTQYVTGESDHGLQHIWYQLEDLLAIDSSYTDRDADSNETIFTVRMQPNHQIRDFKLLTIDSANDTYGRIYDIAKSSYDYYAPS